MSIGWLTLLFELTKKRYISHNFMKILSEKSVMTVFMDMINKCVD